MLKKTRSLIFILVCLIFLINITFLPKQSEIDYNKNDIFQNPQSSANLEGVDYILVTNAERYVNISGFGVVTIEDYISIKNLNHNPITSMLIAIPLNQSINLMHYEAKGIDGNSLLTERSHLIMNEYEMITVYFESPLLPFQTKRIIFYQQFTGLLVYTFQNEHQYINYTGYVFPTLPYRSLRSMLSIFNVPLRAEGMEGGWGFEQTDLFFIKYDLFYIKDSVEGAYVEPFLKNLNKYKIVRVSFFKDDVALMEFEEINREIFISPWGIIKVSEEYIIKNYGIASTQYLYLNIPKSARDVYLSDDIGEILGLRLLNKGKNKELRINLLQNRVRLLPNSSFRFKIKYYLPFEKYFSLNWFQESIEIDLFITSFEYFGKRLNIKLIIDGCYSLDRITLAPEAVKKTHGTMTLIFTSDSIC
ncbi:MAG: hypothetical protein ACFFBE_16845, partial [Promethearchaeota archaeon]